MKTQRTMVIATTHIIEKYGIPFRFDRRDLESMASQLSSRQIPMLVEHDWNQVIQAELNNVTITETDDSEWALVALFEADDSEWVKMGDRIGMSVRFDSLLFETGNDPSLPTIDVAFEPFLDTESWVETRQNLKDAFTPISEVANVRVYWRYKLSIDPGAIEIAINGGAWLLSAVTSGLISHLISQLMVSLNHPTNAAEVKVESVTRNGETTSTVTLKVTTDDPEIAKAAFSSIGHDALRLEGSHSFDVETKQWERSSKSNGSNDDIKITEIESE